MNVQLRSGMGQMKIQTKDILLVSHQLKILGGRYLHHIIKYDETNNWKFILFVLSIEMIPLPRGSFYFYCQLR